MNGTLLTLGLAGALTAATTFRRGSPNRLPSILYRVVNPARPYVGPGSFWSPTEAGARRFGDVKRTHLVRTSPTGSGTWVGSDEALMALLERAGVLEAEVRVLDADWLSPDVFQALQGHGVRWIGRLVEPSASAHEVEWVFVGREPLPLLPTGSRASSASHAQEAPPKATRALRDHEMDWDAVRRELEKRGYATSDEHHNLVDMFTETDQYTEEEAEEAAWNEAKSYYDAFAYAFHRFATPLRLYRVVTAPSLAKINLQKIGVYWSWDRHAAEAYWAGVGHGFLIVGEVDPTNVDWPASYCKNVESSEEKEIELKPGAPVHILRIRDEDTGTIVRQNVKALAHDWGR